MTVVFDPNASLASNRIVNESHVVEEPYIEPDYSPFYLKDFELKGTPKGGGADIVLELVDDFSYSPPYVSMQVETGLPVHSYIILNDYEAWSHVKWTYRAVGQDSTHFQDTVLLNEIANRGTFDRLNLSIWRSFYGELTQVPFAGFTYNLSNSQILQMFMQRMSAIAIALQEPSKLINYFQNTIGKLQTDISTIKSLTDSWKAAFNQANFFDNPLLTSLSLDNLLRQKTITRLSDDLDIYVNPTATGEETGLTSDDAFTTIQQAFDYVSYLIGSEFEVTIHLADGTYPEIAILRRVNNILLTILGNNNNPENVVITGGIVASASIFSYGGMTFSTTNANCLQLHDFSKAVQLDNVIFSNCLSSTTHIVVNGFSKLGIVDVVNYKISGNAKYHMISTHDSEIALNNVKLTLIDIPHFDLAFLYVNGRSSFGYVNGFNIVDSNGDLGSATGKRFILGTYGSITGTGGNENKLPGSIAGDLTSSQYTLYL